VEESGNIRQAQLGMCLGGCLFAFADRTAVCALL